MLETDNNNAGQPAFTDADFSRREDLGPSERWGDRDWWRGAVIYQIYPRSFRDTSGDGVGDLPGIIEKLDYLASLGVDAIWVSPFFKSPMKDFGYDVSDHRAVDPIFGQLSDFDRLVAEAQRRGLKVLIDVVLSHTSDEHPWFRDSRRDRGNPRADWYVWADPKPDGTPPNNWLSVFGGAAWTWEPRRGQYYLHHFLAGQPDLNFHNVEVQDAILAEVEFWLGRGVDGFRLDAAHAYFHDTDLRDNPALASQDDSAIGGAPFNNPHNCQLHVHSMDRPENIAFLKRFRALLDRYPGTTSIAEINTNDSLATVAAYTKGGDRLHMGYTFDLLADDFSATHFRRVVGYLENRIEDGWPCWAFSNHDVVRAVSRWGGKAADERFAKLLPALLLSLRGSTCLYQGEELGLPEASLSFEQLQDPYGKAFWPDFSGRDGCRTPMPWTAQARGGFTLGEPWLPLPAEHLERAVEQQDADPDSVLNAFRGFLAWRNRHPALRQGEIRFLDTDEPLLAFERRSGDEHLIAVFNLGAEPVMSSLGERAGLRPLSGHGFTAQLDEGLLHLPGFGAFFGSVAPR